METMEKSVSVAKLLEQAASTICAEYCKWPEQYITDQPELEDIMTEKLCHEHCNHCPMVQFFL